MLHKSLAIAAVLAYQAAAQTQEQKDAYPDMAERFDKFGITWEPIDVHTEDGYQMTAFHITGNRDGPINVTGPSVVM